MNLSKLPKLQEALSTWTALNDFLRTATEDEAFEMLRLERGGKRRIQYLLRIYSRYNHTRATREREEILGGKS
jgi:hypothetical protein